MSQSPTQPPEPLRPCVAVDVDGVLAQFDHWEGIDMIGDPIEGAVLFVNNLIAAGFRVLIHSTRTNPELNNPADSGRANLESDPWRRRLKGLLTTWLRTHGFPLAVEVYAGPGKPLAVAYVDDRAVACRPQDGSGAIAIARVAYSAALSRVKSLFALQSPAAAGDQGDQQEEDDPAGIAYADLYLMASRMAALLMLHVPHHVIASPTGDADLLIEVGNQFIRIPGIVPANFGHRSIADPAPNAPHINKMVSIGDIFEDMEPPVIPTPGRVAQLAWAVVAKDPELLPWSALHLDEKNALSRLVTDTGLTCVGDVADSVSATLQARGWGPGATRSESRATHPWVLDPANVAPLTDSTVAMWGAYMNAARQLSGGVQVHPLAAMLADEDGSPGLARAREAPQPMGWAELNAAPVHPHNEGKDGPHDSEEQPGGPHHDGGPADDASSDPPVRPAV